MGRSARGVKGISLRAGDKVVDMVLASHGSSLLTVCENGFGKRTDLNDYRRQRRGGIGLINIKTTERNGKVVALKTVNPDDDLMLISAKGIMIRTGLDQIRDIGRNTQGVRLIRLDPGGKLVAVARVVKEEKPNGTEENNQVTDTENNIDENNTSPENNIDSSKSTDDETGSDNDDNINSTDSNSNTSSTDNNNARTD